MDGIPAAVSPTRTGTRDFYWAAIPDFKAKLTRVGRYDADAFKFTPVRELPDIIFTAM